VLVVDDSPRFNTMVDGNRPFDPERDRATWKPNPTIAFMGHGPGRIFQPDGKGGGRLMRRSKVTKRWIEDAVVVPYGA
jgi:hypothetical protein